MENENITPTEPQNPTMEVSPIVAAPVKANSSVGALIGTMIIIVILILGGAYLWSTRVQPKISAPTENTQPADDANTAMLEQSADAADAQIDQLTSQSPSDETASIEADLNATDLNSLDKELQSI
ncbi:MAG: hypothetical protein WC878_07015 [Candidatus Paceibacterota bacterium]|jgi:cytoskeletal protein RodZ